MQAELNTYYVSAFKAASGRTLYAARICCPLLDCEHVFDSQEDAEAFIARETASLAEYGIALHKVNAPAEMTSIQLAFARDGAEFYQQNTCGDLSISERRWMYVYVYASDVGKIKETCRRIAALNEKYGFKWEPCQCGSEVAISVFCNWWEEQEVNAALN